MRSSNLFIATLKESPADAELMSHKLMLRAGLIRKLGSGLYSWLPLGLKILRKVEAIVREEMNAINAQEILMPAIQPAELWQETGRWDQYGQLMLKIQDRHKRSFCFGPTHEEGVTDLIRKELKSYKQLPLCVYQIQTKFRDEIRPRFGVMRAREFLMKDAYSFHTNQASLQTSYDQMFNAYQTIFTRLGLEFRAVFADTGEIGGTQSHEFHALAESGEDLIAYSDQGSYAANLEFATTPAPKATFQNVTPEDLTTTLTPGITSSAEQAAFMKIPLSSMLKTMLVKGRAENSVIALLLRGDRELNPLKAAKHPWVASPLTLISLEELSAVTGTVPGFVGPLSLNIPMLADHSVVTLSNFSCGANVVDTHFINVNWNRDLPLPPLVDLSFVQAGDASPEDPGTLSFLRGIEVGHIFQLGTQYTQAMNATVLSENGQSEVLSMGCYGIGISRIVAAAIEQSFDDKGIIWSRAMAPFDLVIVPINFHKSETVQKEAQALYHKLKGLGLDILLDDRNERPGSLFADMELIGIPHRLVISDKGLEAKTVEYKARTDTEARLIPEPTLMDFLKELFHDKQPFSTR